MTAVSPLAPREKRSRGAAPSPVVRSLLRGLPTVPAVILLAVFLAGPIAYCVYYAFTDMQLTGTSGTDFVGFDNFTRAFKDDDFLNAVKLTLVFVVGSAVVGQNTLGLALALMMQKASKPVRSLISGVVIAAWVLPEVVAGYLMYAFFFDQGSLNSLLDAIGLPTQNWLYTMPILAVCLANVWRGTAFSLMVFTAAINDVPAELTEAAEMDGANAWQRLWRVTLPVIRPTILTNLMLITLQTLSVFGLIYTMTRGGPGNKSETLPIFMYQQAFQNSLIGYGTAIALVLLVVGALFSIVYIRLLKMEDD
ncbi:carbohydrate ABC transporter permease [Streptomyces acidiscabies]|uniref:carbohydrate ABC transporter permease n=1 Tax=Streptomyces acidiscabies TaxID=42234 RepID=UPI000289B651|nr:sugar ABC transporter permease [Streptomyces sp. LBUM 1476]MBZ3913130.1 sugar ABC transporter permease [Streptomyces acidiscabies]GAQ53897.1 trehalose transport system permease protein [Streptomyces acidiscabies]GAV38091.1 trehalose transport system permease protein [Streptomyces acidiscabies]